MKKVNIALLGLGVVGGGTYEILRSNGAMIKKHCGVDINVKRILEINPKRAEMFGVESGVVTTNIDDIINDDSISIVAEFIGGIEPARTFILKAFAAGKTVVSANKELIAKHFAELEGAARASKAGFYYEASCVGGVPIIRTLYESMQANNFSRIMGIFNGTTNYILTKMTQEGLSYEQALAEAQGLGYAEANPAADVEGFDAVYKLSILSSIAFRTHVPFECIYREGITGLKAVDIANGQRLGYITKLLAIGERNGREVSASVSPYFVSKNHPLAAVGGVYNAVHMRGDFVDDVMLYGRGAGAHPTGSAIVSDIVCAAANKTHKYSPAFSSTKLRVQDDYQSQFYLRLTAVDRAGVMAKVTAVLAKLNISINKMTQSESDDGFASVIFLTHVTGGKQMRRAAETIAGIDGISSVDSLIRVMG